MSNIDICSSTIEEIQAVSGENLLFAFIAGSRAREDYNANSDIDLFLVLRNPCLELELKIAEKLRLIHGRYQLKFNHCGEILSQKTLDYIVRKNFLKDFFKENIFYQTACFNTQCILSKVRKALVILHMLASEKRLFVGDRIEFEKYEKFGQRFLLKNPLPSNFREVKMEWRCTDALVVDIKKQWDIYTLMIRDGQLTDTPMGISLERWFNQNSFQETDFVYKSRVSKTSLPTNECPLSRVNTTSFLGELLASQCLGIPERYALI